MQSKAGFASGKAPVLRLSPYGFIHYAKEFFSAAQSIPRQDRFSPVAYYLYCHSLELGLKAFILAQGGKVDDVKNDLKHDLIKALEKAKNVGLDSFTRISPSERAELSGKEAALPPPPPLRTARDSFPSGSSSLHERPWRDAAALVRCSRTWICR